MQLGYVILAEAADVTRSGKLALLGGNVEVFNSPTFPASIPALVLVVALIVAEDECDIEHAGTLAVLSSDGEPILPETTYRFTPHRNPPELSELPIRFVFFINLSGVSFPAPGTYTFRLSVDGAQLTSVPVVAALTELAVPSTATDNTNTRSKP